MKWLIMALAVALAPGAVGEVLSDANMPKYDIEAGCKAEAHIEPGDLPVDMRAPDQIALGEKTGEKYCAQFQRQMKDLITGKDVSPDLLQYCVLDAKLHGDIGSEYPNLAACILKEPGVENLRKFEKWARSGFADCKERPEYTRCYADNDHRKLLYMTNPGDLGGEDFDTCFASLKLKGEGGKSWQLLGNCMLDEFHRKKELSGH